MNGFADIHTHILYGLDDGPETLEQSLAMLERARSAGTSDIVATPHANRHYTFRPEVIDRQIAELSARVTGITLHRGCDFHLMVTTIEDALAHPKKYTINHRGYLLLEFPDVTIFPNYDAILGRLRDAGMLPIVTHPERNRYMQQHPDVLARWVEHGCYLQVTAGSFTGLFGKRARASADALMRRNMVHIVASDAHDVKMRPPDLRDAYRLVSKEWGEERARSLFVDNPQAVLQGAEFEASTARSLPKRRWFTFWK